MNSLKTKNDLIGNGFSLVETIVAISIILVVLVNPITSAQRSLVAAEYAKDQMVASYLAEEGLEYIRLVRDFNLINDNDWLDSLTDCEAPGSSNKACGVDPINTQVNQQIIQCNNPDNSNDCRLNLYASGVYTHAAGGTVTQFRRWVRILDGSYDDEKKVEVTVEWKTEKLPKKTISVSGFITNWKAQVQ